MLFELGKIWIAALSVFAACAAPAQAQSFDHYFSDDEVKQAVSAIGIGECANQCIVNDIEVERLAAYHQSAKLGHSFRLLRATQGCGSEGCTRALVAVGYDGIRYMVDGFRIDIQGELQRAAAAGSLDAYDFIRTKDASEIQAEASDLLNRLLPAYGDDPSRIELIAKNADYALMAHAAYGDQPAMELLSVRGWVPIKNYADPSLLSGTAVATRFVSTDGRNVMAFRGTTEKLDWVTNVPGTLGLPAAQIDKIRAFIREAQSEAPGVIFVGTLPWGTFCADGQSHDRQSSHRLQFGTPRPR